MYPDVLAAAEGRVGAREDDGRWIANIVALPRVLACGGNVDEARARAEALALRVIADRLEHGEQAPASDRGDVSLDPE